MAKKEKARANAGDEQRTGQSKSNNRPEKIQEIFSEPAAEERLIGGALFSWPDVAPLPITNDLFTDPSLRKMWKAIAANPTAGQAAIPKDLQARADRIMIEVYNGEDPGALVGILIDARNKRTLQTAIQKLQNYKDGETATAIWADVSRYVETAITPPSIIETLRWTPDSLAAAEFPEPKWIIPDLIPSGITLLAGRTKIGKSWLALKWGAEIKGKVVYATYEDTARRLKSRTKRLGITGNDLTIIPHPPWKMPQALNELAADITPDTTAIIIDPWTSFKPFPKDNARAYEVDYEAFAQLRRWIIDMNVSALVIHHTRKATVGRPGDPLDEPLGSTALTAATDTTAILERKNDTEGILHIRGRDVEAKELALTFNDCKWIILGYASEAVTGARAEIIAALKEANEPMTPAEVAAALGEPRASIKVVMSRMYGKNQLDRDRTGKYTVTDVTAAEF